MEDRLLHQHLLPYVDNTKLSSVWRDIIRFLNNDTKNEKLWAYAMLVEAEMLKRGMNANPKYLERTENRGHFFYNPHYRVYMNLYRITTHLARPLVFGNHTFHKLQEDIEKLKNKEPYNYKYDWKSWLIDYKTNNFLRVEHYNGKWIIATL